ncbi:MAG: TonB-dependent receptor [Pirellulaceae bacterium]|nr:TonB-dependent receptor [Pirellulaceae bacterium]
METDPDELTPEEEEAILELDIGELNEIQVVPSPFSRSWGDGSVVGESRQQVADSSTANVVSGMEASTRNTTDVGSLLGRSQSNPGVYVQQRSPIISDPRIRGYRFGQYLARADGAFWVPARPDLDSILSKIDSKIVEDIVVINGPYSARYGPGFSFIDVVTRQTPRSDLGTEWAGSSSINYNGNGEQWAGGQFAQGGGESWGASVHYGHLTGSDYLDGSGRRVPASYQSRNLNAAVGFDLHPGTSVEFRYLRQDQSDVEMAGQFTDIDFLTTDGFSLNFQSADHDLVDLITVDGWYNRTRSSGSGGGPAKQALFNSVFDAPAPNGGAITLPRDSATAFDVASAGFTAALTWGDVDTIQKTLGADLRHYRTSLTEDLIRPAGGGGFLTATETVTSLIPDSESTNPGVFGELIIRAHERLTVKTGGRVDWVSVSAGPGVISRRGGASTKDVLGPDRDNSFTLWSAYITGDYDVNEMVTANIGFGLAQRPPTLTELYSMRPFASVLQQGLNRVQGFPFLSPERLKQLDVGLRMETESFRGGARGFYSWIDDYITSQGFAVDPTSSTERITSVFVNTPQATLAGGELFGEWDVDPNTTLFGSLMYVEGKNRTLNQLLFNTPSLPRPPGSSSGAAFGRSAFDQSLGQEALPQIPPLETRLGLRFHESAADPVWGAEFLVRIVDDQDRVADGSLLEQATPGFATFDFRGFYRPCEDLAIIFGVLNFTDRHYREHLDNRAGNQLFQPGVTGYVGSELSY